VLRLLGWALPAFSFALLVALLTLCYRVIPNTRVYWRAAFAGAVVVATLLLLNKAFAAFYLQRIVMTRSLYGSVALPLVIMIGFYVFWLFILTGAIVSYAVQNFHFRNSQAAWGSLSEAMRERLSLVVLLAIGRRFQACEPPVTASHLSGQIRVPTQILNASLTRLEDLGLIHALPAPEGGSSTDYLYQPARPLGRITLAEFKQLFAKHGDDPAGDTLDALDPLVRRYQEKLRALAAGDAELLQKPLDQLLIETPYGDAIPAPAPAPAGR
jgi:membrane protein